MPYVGNDLVINILLVQTTVADSASWLINSLLALTSTEKYLLAGNCTSKLAVTTNF